MIFDRILNIFLSFALLFIGILVIFAINDGYKQHTDEYGFNISHYTRTVGGWGKYNESKSFGYDKAINVKYNSTDCYIFSKDTIRNVADIKLVSVTKATNIQIANFFMYVMCIMSLVGSITGFILVYMDYKKSKK